LKQKEIEKNMPQKSERKKLIHENKSKQ